MFEDILPSVRMYSENTRKYLEIFFLSLTSLLFLFKTNIPLFKYPFLAFYVILFAYSIIFSLICVIVITFPSMHSKCKSLIPHGKCKIVILRKAFVGNALYAFHWRYKYPTERIQCVPYGCFEEFYLCDLFVQAFVV